MADDMLTNFTNLYMNRPREAEHSDTRHEIRRHDPDQEKRKQQDQDKKSPSLFNEEDYAVVSVAALRLFLQNFLGTLEPQTATPAPISQDASRPRQGNAAYAAHAYAHASETKSANRFVETPAPTPTATQASNLPNEDIRTIHRLLENLKILSERNIENIRIERGESFLQSLSNGIDKALGL